MEFLIKYQRSTAKAFLIKYQDLEDEYTKEIYNQVLKHFDIEESIPLLIIGDNKIVNYTKKSETTIIEVIQEQMENDTNIVTEIKKGNTQTKKDS